MHGYFVREAAKPFFLIALLLTGLFIAYSLTRFLTEANEGLLSASAVVSLTGLKALIALEVLLPIALYVGLIVALGRLHSDWEVIALRTGGVSENRILAPVLIMAALVAVLVALLSLWVRPWAYELLYRLEAEAKASAELDELPPGRFHIHGDAERTVFLNARNGGTGEVEGIFVHARRGDALEVISAGRGSLASPAGQDAQLLTLRQAFVYRQAAAGEDLVGRFNALAIRAPTIVAEPLGHRPKSAATKELLASARNEDRAEAQWRLSTAFSTLLLALAAAPLSRTGPRRGRYARVLLAAVLYTLYFNGIGIARSAVEQGDLTHLWWAPGGFAAAIGAAWLASRRAAP